MSDQASRKKYFTKHLFRAGLQCPTKLYYYARHYPQDDRIRPFLEHAGYNKRQLKKLLHALHPDGIFVSGTSYDGSFDDTKSHVVSDQVTLFNSVFIDDGCAAKIPLLIKNDERVALYFIQGKALNPNKHRLSDHHGKLHKKWKQYIYDAAYQIHIIGQCYPSWKVMPYLLLPNKNGKATSDKLNQQIYHRDIRDIMGDELELMHSVDIASYVDEIFNGDEATLLPAGYSFTETLVALRNQYFAGSWKPTAIGRKCKDCEFRLSDEQLSKGQESGFNRCWLQAPEAQQFEPGEPHVFELIGAGLNELLEQDIYLQRNVPLNYLPVLANITTNQGTITHKQRQALQVMKAKGVEAPEEIIKPAMLQDVGRWEYPLHFLDFEAGNFAVPIRKNRSPYHLLIFQFSCHTLHQDGTLDHHEWIARDQEPYPNYEMVRRLKQVPGIESGTIIQYSNFERTALKIIRNELQNECDEVEDAPEHIDWLESIIGRNDSNSKRGPYLSDLSRLIKNYYYNRYMGNSLSIKDVVQSVLTISEALKQNYQKPYNSTNFKDMQWWQWDEKRNEVRNPYLVLRHMQSGVKVGRGTEAMVTFGKILNRSLRETHQEQAIRALLQYCELDTLAMVMIYQHLEEINRNG